MKEILGFNCSVLRQNRKSFRVSVSSSGRITLSVPKRATVKQITEFVKKQEVFIKNALTNQRALHDQGLFGEAPDAPFLYYIGKKLPVRFENVTTAELKTDCFILPEGLTVDEYRKIITELYRTAAKNYITVRAEELSKKVGISYKKLRFAASTSRWGSRSSSGTVSFSIYLIATPPECIDHVIYHEFAHTKEMNHSKKFYELLESFEPEHRERQAELHKVYGKYLHKFKPNSNTPENGEQDRDE